MEKKSNKEEVVRSLVRFMEASSLADFRSRLDILRSVSILLELIGSNKSNILAALKNLYSYYSGLNPGVDQAFKSAEKRK